VSVASFAALVEVTPGAILTSATSTALVAARTRRSVPNARIELREARPQGAGRGHLSLRAVRAGHRCRGLCRLSPVTWNQNDEYQVKPDSWTVTYVRLRRLTLRAGRKRTRRCAQSRRSGTGVRALGGHDERHVSRLDRCWREATHPRRWEVERTDEPRVPPRLVRSEVAGELPHRTSSIDGKDLAEASGPDVDDFPGVDVAHVDDQYQTLPSQYRRCRKFPVSVSQ
jgi:hypothetical protein